MNDSHAKAREYLLKIGAEHIWVKPHYRFSTDCFCKEYSYKMQDIFNLFDGLCSYKKQLWGVQVSTGKYHEVPKYIDFQFDWAQNLPIFLIKVNSKTGDVEHKELQTFKRATSKHSA